MRNKTLTITGALAATCCAMLALSAGPASATGHTLPAAAAAPAQFGWCDNTDPSGNPDAETVLTSTAGSASIELRYSPSAQCAWGKVYGNVGASVWVDRSSDGGSTWQGKLGDVAISSGTDAYTTQFDDHGVLMRACADDGSGAIHCTGWY